MGFIFGKPLSIEQIFSHFNTDGGEQISRQEAEDAKNTSIFQNFKVQEGMTLETFERANEQVYKTYEQNATLAYNKQQKQIKEWIEMEQEALTKLEKEAFSEVGEKELRETLKMLVEEYDLYFTKEELETMPLKDLEIEINRRMTDKMVKEETKKHVPRFGD